MPRVAKSKRRVNPFVEEWKKRPKSSGNQAVMTYDSGRINYVDKEHKKNSSNMRVQISPQDIKLILDEFNSMERVSIIAPGKDKITCSFMLPILLFFILIMIGIVVIKGTVGMIIGIISGLTFFGLTCLMLYKISANDLAYHKARKAEIDAKIK